MFKDNGPLMFINTVSTNIKDVAHQKIFDSRTQKQQKIKSKTKLSFLEERKINNVIEMYEKERPVLCNIICNEQEIVGIPYKKVGRKLSVKISEEDIRIVNLDDITDIIIIRF